MEALSGLEEDDMDNMMRDLGFSVGLSAEIYFVTLSRNTYWFVGKMEEEWLFWKQKFYSKRNFYRDSFYRDHIRSRNFFEVYERARRYMIWLKKEYVR